MFQKKQYIYSETQGVCQVENIVQLSVKGGKSMEYYVLKPLFDSEKVAYIPVKDHKVVLRELFSVEEAKQLSEDPNFGENTKLKAAVDFVLQKERGQKNVTAGHA